MFAAQKQSLPVQFLKFGVDDQGVIVPILRHDKGTELRRGLLVRALQLKWKTVSRLH
jgi:hypothetical protein